MTPEAFWTFSVAFYARPDVANACIALQDEYAVDVDVLLFVLWCASRGHRLEAPEFRAAAAVVAPWHELVVKPIRKARRALKPVPAGPFDQTATLELGRQLLSAELAAERIQHGALQALAPQSDPMDPAEAARGNLACFAEQTHVPIDAAPLAVLLRAAS